LIGLGRLDDAQVQIEGLPEKLRETASARETGAKLALVRGKPGEAITLLRPLTEAADRRASTLALYGAAQYAAEQVNVAAAAYDAALELDAGLPEALIGRAEVHLRAERADDALELLDDARNSLNTRLRAPELHARMITHLGHAYIQRDKRRDLDRALDVLREAVQIPGAPAEAHFWLGESLGGRKTPEATAAFKRYLELEPGGKYAGRAKRALGPLL
jgi:tetratricopeptide (TPR) repeat protein